jgi:hypothetical protein
MKYRSLKYMHFCKIELDDDIICTRTLSTFRTRLCVWDWSLHHSLYPLDDRRHSHSRSRPATATERVNQDDYKFASTSCSQYLRSQESQTLVLLNSSMRQAFGTYRTSKNAKVRTIPIA